jgi:hypothetical protein
MLNIVPIEIERAHTKKEAAAFFEQLERGELPIFIDCAEPHFGPQDRYGELGGLAPSQRLIRIVGLSLNHAMDVFQAHNDESTRLAQQDVGCWHHDAHSVRKTSPRKITVSDVLLGSIKAESIGLHHDVSDERLGEIRWGEGLQPNGEGGLDYDPAIYEAPYFADTLYEGERLFMITDGEAAQAHQITTLGVRRVTINQPYEARQP